MNLSSRIAAVVMNPLRIFHTDFWAGYLRKQLSLNFYQDKVDHDTVIDYEAIHKELQTYSDEGTSGDSEDWDVADMADAHFVLFNGSMSLLTLSGETEEKLDILAWIFAPNFQERIIKGKIVNKHVSDMPFSFYRCAKEVGINDVDQFREMLMSQFEPELAAKLKMYIQLLYQK